MKILSDTSNILLSYEKEGQETKKVNNNKIDIADLKDAAVILDISLDGMQMQKLQENSDRDLSKVISPLNAYKRLDYLPEYSGIYSVDKTISSAVENCSEEEKGFIYNVIRNNFLIKNAADLSEEERQENITLGLQKAEYAAENFINADKKADFLQAMRAVADLAAQGKSDGQGIMDYGISKAHYLGSGSNLVETTDTLAIMKKYDSKAYAEYEKLEKNINDNASQENIIEVMRYHLNWFNNAVKKNPYMVETYAQEKEKTISAILSKK